MIRKCQPHVFLKRAHSKVRCHAWSPGKPGAHKTLPQWKRTRIRPKRGENAWSQGKRTDPATGWVDKQKGPSKFRPHFGQAFPASNPVGQKLSQAPAFATISFAGALLRRTATWPTRSHAKLLAGANSSPQHHGKSQHILV